MEEDVLQSWFTARYIKDEAINTCLFIYHYLFYVYYNKIRRNIS